MPKKSLEKIKQGDSIKTLTQNEVNTKILRIKVSAQIWLRVNHEICSVVKIDAFIKFNITLVLLNRFLSNKIIMKGN